MRRFNFGISCLAIASVFFAASSCSDDLEEDSQKTKEALTDEAYISVSIQDVESSTRADEADGTAAEAKTFEYGTSAERDIKTADFYFFFANGDFASHNTATSLDGTPNGTSPDPVNGIATSDRIEWNGHTTVLVPDFDVMNPPAYVVTILNKPSSLPDDVADIKELREALAQIPADDNGNVLNAAQLPYTYKSGTTSADGFIMTTSTFYDTDASTARQDVGVTYLNSNMFYNSETEAAADGAHVVTIYVERLAAKVRVNMASGLTKLTVNGTDLYQIGTKALPIKDGTNADGKTLYAKIVGWGINGQPTASYLIKRINTAWTDASTSLGFIWNEADNHRSFWAESYNYGKYGSGTDDYKYLERYQKAYDEQTRATEEIAEVTEGTEATATSGRHLIYLPETSLKNSINDALYCPENTNTGAILSAVENYQGAVTCVLINAILTDSVGTPQPVILYNGDLYTENGFMQAVLNASGYSTLVDKDDATNKLDITDLELTDDSYYNGRVKVVLNENAKKSTWKDGSNTVSADDINKTFAKYTTNDAAVHYKDGMMYYSVPIEHLRGNAPSKTEIANATERNILEGQFGVVRNHIYDLTVTEIANLGHGIHNEDEPIVPPLEKDAKYYIGAKVNILSWKVVSQSVNL
jgi:hypothetical protein